MPVFGRSRLIFLFLENILYMKKNAMTISEAKDKIFALKGKEVRILVNKGRKKTEKYSGFVTGIFPCVFTLEIKGEHPVSTLSYAYSDVVCGNVKFKE